MTAESEYSVEEKSYRGRIAPTPSGLLHAGHARTFWIAWHRSRQFKGSLIYRTEDLDPLRCKAYFADSALEDMRWLGLSWMEGPEMGGAFAPYCQSARTSRYILKWKKLLEDGHIFPCRRSRKELRAHPLQSGGDGNESLYPREWRPKETNYTGSLSPGTDVAWRFRVPFGRKVLIDDGCLGKKIFVAGEDFGDFVVWRRDGIPAYELAVVVDDMEMKITEVVRGQDLLLSTARQLLLYDAFGQTPPDFFHCPLLLDDEGQKLSKSLGSRAVQEHRANGANPKEWTETFEAFYRGLI